MEDDEPRSSQSPEHPAESSGHEYEEPVKKGAHPAWFPPKNPADATGLRVHNSLTGDVEEFKAARGRAVRWYTCGPTVYDVAHMGHARAYLTFDILRRIMEDYFGYEVIYQINVTDIDDKIILRARRNKLLADYRGAGHSMEVVGPFVDEAVRAFDEAMQSKLAQLQEPLPAGAPAAKAKERQVSRRFPHACAVERSGGAPTARPLYRRSSLKCMSSS